MARAVSAAMMGLMPLGFRVLRAAAPLARFGGTVIVTRHDDVRQVLEDHETFAVPYEDKLDVIMGGQKFLLGIDDTARHEREAADLRQVVRAEDIAQRLTPAVERLSAQAVVEGNGRLEVVSFVRDVTFSVLCEYFGVTDPPGGDLRVSATRLFEFQFADPGGDPALRAEVDRIAPALRAHIQSLIAQRRAGEQRDDMLGRCLAKQAEGASGFDDDRIRTALMGFVVGGPPQPPMVVPNALEQLLRRPEALAAARQAARAQDIAQLAAHLFEAMRFDPIGPALFRTVARDSVIAAGCPRAKAVSKGTKIIAAFSSAMMDPRRVASPQNFDAGRPASDYMLFGHGMHTCFGLRINQAILPAMLAPLLSRPGLRREAGAPGRLSKRGAFADRLVVRYD